MRGISRAANQDLPRISVDIYVTKECPICHYAHDVAAMIRTNFPSVAVHLIWIDEPNITIPENVFATPTYLLNGNRWSLGNPSPEQVQETLTAALNG